MTWLLRSIDHNLSASAARKACSAGIIADPGSLAAPARFSTPSRTRSGTNKNSPPQLVANSVPGARVNVRTSATGSTVGAGPADRSSSRRRGSGAKPSARNTSRTAVGLKGILRSASTSAISYIEWFCLRSAMTRSCALDFCGCSRGPGVGGNEELRVRIAAKRVAEHAKGARAIAEVARHFMRRAALQEEGAQGLVHALARVGGFREEAAVFVSFLCWASAH